jgi:hypothetical protein
MTTIEIKIYFEKNFPDKFFIIAFYLARLIFRYIKIYIHNFSVNYSKYRSKNKIPRLKDIDFKKNLYPFASWGILLPTIIGYVLKFFVSKDTLLILAIIYAFIFTLISSIGIIYFVYRAIIDFIASTYCFIKSLIKTTISTIKFLRNKIFTQKLTS